MVFRKQRMQSLILEILHAQPSLRDSKTYLNAFGPRASSASQGSSLNASAAVGPSKSIALPSASAASVPSASPQPSAPSIPFGSGKRKEKQRALDRPQAADLPPEFWQKQQQHWEATAEAEEDETGTARKHTELPEQAESSKSSTNSTILNNLASTDKTVVTVAPDASIQTEPRQEVPVPSLDHVPQSQQHVALVKIQGPFSARQLSSIAEGMVYLKRLGLVSIIVVDNEDWHPSSAPAPPKKARTSPSTILATKEEVSKFGRDGTLLTNSREEEEAEFQAWASSNGRSSPSEIAHAANRRYHAQGQESLRKRMIAQTHLLAELLTSYGSQARPFPHAMMRVDSQGAQDSHAALVASLNTAAASSGPSSTTTNPTSMLDDKDLEARSPLVADDQLHALRSALLADQIPVLAPLALWNDAETGAVRTVSVSADDLMVNLAREMSLEGVKSATSPEEEEIDLTPVRMMIINREGGIPSHARGGSPHLSINLASEHKMIEQSFIWGKTHPTALSNLSTVRACLAYMPQTSSGIVVSHRSPRSLIANLITNKAAHSPSLPHRLLAGRKDVRHTPTIIRSGLSVKVLYDFEKINWDKMTDLLEASFGRKLDRDNYIERVRHSLDFIIVTGDYEGAAIVTKEYAPSDDRSSVEPIAYLDKFAMLPSLQGSGAVDFLWGALRDEVHGLGLLDALNDNGGKGGFGSGRDLVWKSRANNPVNRWYYERSNGFVKIDTRSEAERASSDPLLNWSLFWCDAEERLARMAGEIRLRASARPEDVMDLVDEEEEARFRAAQALLEDGNAASNFASEYHSSSGSRMPSRAVMAAALAAAGQSSTGAFGSPFQRDLNELSNPVQSESGGNNLLPVVAPEEDGRIQRWAECMRTIPTAWL